MKRSRTAKRASQKSQGDTHPRRWSVDSGELATSRHTATFPFNGKGATDQMNDALMCAICRHLLDEQLRVLDCGHSFCLECLERCVASKSRRQRGSLSCPKCKQVTDLPPEGVSSLKTNYDLIAIRDAIVEMPSGTSRRYQDGQIGNAQMSLNNATERFQRYLKENKDLTRSIKDIGKKVDSDINEHFKVLYTILEENKHRLLQEVEDIRNARLNKVELDRVTAERTMKIFKECREHLKKVEKMKTSDDEYAAQLNAVCSESYAIVNNRPPEVDRNLSWLEYVPETAAEGIHYGRLKTDRTIELELESEFGKGWFFRLGKARGISVTQSGMIAVAECSLNRVSVWENIMGEYQRKLCLKTPWYVQALQKPTDVAVTSEGNFVVVDGANTIKIFSASGEYDESEWLKEEGTTSVTSDPRFHRSTRILMDSGKNIARYDISGNILPPIVAGITSHTIATNGSKIAVSNCKEVRMFDVDSGEMLLSFEARIKGLCFDDKTDSVLATTFDRKIGQYCTKTGQRLAVVSPECLHDPWGLVILPGRKLAVADDQSVKVYRIRDH